MPRRVERYLPYVPLANSEHVYVNGVEQRFGTDYTIQNTSHVIIPSAAELGDTVEVLYAHQSAVGAPAPTFNEFAEPPQSGACVNSAFPWENTHDYSDWTFVLDDETQWDRPLENGEVLGYTSTMADISYRFAGVAGYAVYLDGWFYFKHPDGCIRSYNYITGNIPKQGYSGHSSITIPIALNVNGHFIAVGSRLVAWSMNNYGAGGQRKIKWRQ